MIRHIVLWKLAPHAEGATKEENALIIKSKLEALKEIISEIRGFKVGININDSDAAYDVALYSSFDTRQDLDSYQRHEKHKEAADWVAKVRLQRIVVDYEV